MTLVNSGVRLKIIGCKIITANISVVINSDLKIAEEKVRTIRIAMIIPTKTGKYHKNEFTFPRSNISGIFFSLIENLD
jgi:hypothetical protein